MSFPNSLFLFLEYLIADIYNTMSAILDYRKRQLASLTDNEQEWFKQRLYNVSASDVAMLSRESSIPGIVKRKFESNFFGNKYTFHGNSREPYIAEWIQNTHGISPNNHLFHSEGDLRHLATPDGVEVIANDLVLSEIKTTNKPFKKIPLKYLRQIYWQQYVLGAQRTLFVWEEHNDFVPTHTEPKTLWVERNNDVIASLQLLAVSLVKSIDSYSP